MSEDFGNDLFTVTDEDGREFMLEHIGTIEYSGEMYMAFLPADMDENDPDYGIIMLKSVEEDGEEMLLTIDDELELATVYDMFMELLFSEDGESPGEQDS